MTLFLAAALAFAALFRVQLHRARHIAYEAALRAEQADEELDAVQQRLQRQAAQEREWLAVLAHELRSPVAAVQGYAELLAEGTLGPVEQRAADAALRMQQAAEQLLRIIEGIEEVAADRSASINPIETVPARELLDEAAAAIRTETDARNITLHVAGSDILLATRRDDALRTLLLGLGAAVKVSPGTTLTLSATGGDVPALLVRGSRLDAQRDEPDRARDAADDRLTGAGLRIALARRTARLVEGIVSLESDREGTSLRLSLPRLVLIDDAEDIP